MEENIEQKIADELNAHIDIPRLNEQEEGYLFHILVALFFMGVYILIKFLPNQELHEEG